MAHVAGRAVHCHATVPNQLLRELTLRSTIRGTISLRPPCVGCDPSIATAKPPHACSCPHQLVGAAWYSPPPSTGTDPAIQLITELRRTAKSPGNRCVSGALLLSGREDLKGPGAGPSAHDAPQHAEISGACEGSIRPVPVAAEPSTDASTDTAVGRDGSAATAREVLIAALARAIEDGSRAGESAVVHAATLALASLARG